MKQEEIRDEQRVKEQMYELAVAEGMQPEPVSMPNYPGGGAANASVHQKGNATAYN